MLFWLDEYHYLNSKGFRFMYGRISNMKSDSLLMKIGGKRVAKLSIPINGEEVTLGFVRFPLKPIS